MQEEELLKKLRDTCHVPDIDTSNFDIRDFIFAFGSPLEAIMYSRIFWPRFVEIKGMIFLEGTIEDDQDRQRLAEVFEKYEQDVSRTEEDFNLVEVPSDLFGRRGGETSEEEDRWLAELLTQMWAARLHSLYPTRQFVVKVLSADETGGEVGVIFYQRRS